jgi:hypothetical protein
LVRLEEKRGKVHEPQVTVYGWKVLLLIDAATKTPLAVNVGPLQEHEALWTRALVTQVRLNLQGEAQLHKVLFDQGFLDGTTLWWLDQHAVTSVVPVKATMAATADARAQAAAGEAITVGRRVHTRCHGQGRTAWITRLETPVIYIAGLTT